MSIRDIKQDDAFNTTCWPVFSIDKWCCQVTSLAIERTDHNVLLKALPCLRCLLGTLSKMMPSTQLVGQFFPVDKWCCQVTSLSNERTDHHVLMKASSCLRCLLGTLSKTTPSTRLVGQFFQLISGVAR